MDDELERFKREICLPDLAVSFGYAPARGSRGYPDRGASGSLVMKHPVTDDKVVIRRDVDGHWTYFSVRDMSDNGTIIDFVQRRRNTGLGGVRSELRSWLTGASVRPRAMADLVAVERPHRDLASVAAEYARAPVPHTSAYLRGRGIRDETLQSMRFQGTVREDARGNILFGHLHPNDPNRIGGFEKKNRGFTGFATGGVRTVWASRGLEGDQKLVFVEGAIDALSYHQLHPEARARYFSTGGAVGRSQLEFIQRLIHGAPADTAIVLATDNDDAGHRLASQLGSFAGSRPVWRHPAPVGKDWNDYLQAREREHCRSNRSPKDRGVDR